MNKLSLILCTFWAFCSLTYAGSERYSGKEMKQVAPLPSPCPNWTGFYVGVFGGYKFGSVDTDLSLGGDWNFHSHDRDVVEAHAPENLDARGAELGGLIGYNYQFTNLGDIDFDHRAGGGFGNFIGNSEASLREHNASFAIIYKF